MAKDGKIIVYTQGVWDMFHIGHLNILKAAKSFGDILIVGVNKDELVKQYKGHYPLLCWKDRAAVVASCKYVDVVIPTDSLEKDQLLKDIDADVMVHGNDKEVLGSEYMRKNNRRVVYLPYTEGRSSTQLRQALNRFYEEQKGDSKL